METEPMTDVISLLEPMRIAMVTGFPTVAISVQEPLKIVMGI
jgi:hypothetical protein